MTRRVWSTLVHVGEAVRMRAGGVIVGVSRTVRVRLAEADDLDELSELDSVVFGHLAYPYFVLRQLFDVHRGELLVAEQGGRLRGYSLAVRATTSGYGWFLALGVEPASRRCGYGTSLARASLDTLQRHEVKKVLLCVDDKNVAAMGLYRKLGFQVVAELDDYLGPGEPRHLLELCLRSEWAESADGWRTGVCPNGT
jgi:ribosomal protein S18 acetylase RimI-like enzyme